MSDDEDDENGAAEAFNAVKPKIETVIEEPKPRKVRKTDSAEVIAAAMKEPMAKKIAKAKSKAAKEPAEKPERVAKRVSKKAAKPAKKAAKPARKALAKKAEKVVQALRAVKKSMSAAAKPKREKIAQPEPKVAKTMERSYVRRGRIGGGTTIVGGAMQATCTFPPKMFAKLAKAAKADGVSLSEEMRQCVQRALG